MVHTSCQSAALSVLVCGHIWPALLISHKTDLESTVVRLLDISLFGEQKFTTLFHINKLNFSFFMF